MSVRYLSYFSVRGYVGLTFQKKINSSNDEWYLYLRLLLCYTRNLITFSTCDSSTPLSVEVPNIALLLWIPRMVRMDRRMRRMPTLAARLFSKHTTLELPALHRQAHHHGLFLGQMVFRHDRGRQESPLRCHLRLPDCLEQVDLFDVQYVASTTTNQASNCGFLMAS
jgi:hypothetical protein